MPQPGIWQPVIPAAYNANQCRRVNARDSRPRFSSTSGVPVTARVNAQSHKARATSDAYPLEPTHPSAHWHDADTGRYRWRFDLTAISDDVTRPVRWGEMAAAVGERQPGEYATGLVIPDRGALTGEVWQEHQAVGAENRLRDVDPLGVLVWVPPQYVAILRIEADELVGHQREHLLAPADLSEHRSRVAHQHGVPLPYHRAIRLPDVQNRRAGTAAQNDQ